MILQNNQLQDALKWFLYTVLINMDLSSSWLYHEVQNNMQ